MARRVRQGPPCAVYGGASGTVRVAVKARKIAAPHSDWELGVCTLSVSIGNTLATCVGIVLPAKQRFELETRRQRDR